MSTALVMNKGVQREVADLLYAGRTSGAVVDFTGRTVDVGPRAVGVPWELCVPLSASEAAVRRIVAAWLTSVNQHMQDVDRRTSWCVWACPQTDRVYFGVSACPLAT